MTKVNTPLLSLDARGSLADSLTFAGHQGQHIAKSIPKHPDMQSLSQMYQRWRYYDAVQYWHSLSQAQKAVFTAAGSKMHLTGYAKCIRDYLRFPLDQSIWWRLDNVPPAPVIDSSKHGNVPSTVGFLSLPGPVNLADRLDGINDRIRLDSGSGLITATGTVCMWLRFPTLGVSEYVLHFRYNVGDNYIRLGKIASNRMEVYSKRLGVPVAVLYSPAPGVDADWHHYALRQNGIRYDLLQDGFPMTLTGTQDTGFSNTWLNAFFWLGLSSWGYSENDIDDVRFYTRALTDAHILEIATRQLWPLPS